MTSYAAPTAPTAPALPSTAAPRAPEPVQAIEQIGEIEEVLHGEIAEPISTVERVALSAPVIPLSSIEADDRPAPVAMAPRLVAPRFVAPRPTESPQALRPPAQPEPPRAHAEDENRTVERTATAPQLRRFIKSRAYVPMHELRRRFLINGDDDDVTPVDLERKRVFVGLPEREGRLLGELLRAGDIGYELSLDPISPIVVGVYPMRPVTRV